MLTPGQFYNSLADQYDGMTRFDARLTRQRELLSSIITRFPSRQVVDMGCGTGVHAIALAQLGLDVTGVDISAGMLEKAHAHAEETGTDVRFIEGDFLTSLPPGSADLLLCLGNSLPHLPSVEALTEVLTRWRSICSQEGRVIIQLLNYRRVLDMRERIINIRRDGEDTIIRFYDFLDGFLQFNILLMREGSPAITHSLQSTRLTPFTDTDIAAAATSAGFSEVLFYGSLDFTAFSDESTDLLAVLR